MKRRYSNKICPLPLNIVTVCQLSSFSYKVIVMKRENLWRLLYFCILLNIKSDRID